MKKGGGGPRWNQQEAAEESEALEEEAKSGTEALSINPSIHVICPSIHMFCLKNVPNERSWQNLDDPFIAVRFMKDFHA